MDRRDENECAYVLKVVGARLKFGKDEILCGLDMSVPCGKMYTLLGSSGCGKTTLLNCIINAKNLDSGNIYRRWRTCSDIGYMPQETGLNQYLTIKELFQYFSKVHNCSDIEMKKIPELSEMLQLPSFNQLLGTLSGGEQRRVSLALAVMHDPKFLVLDEPTVGQDPILRQSIWDFLMTMIEEKNKTVLITTHYIQEANNSNIVGMMRNGVMVVQETPRSLLERFECSTLEETFIQLCVLQTEEHLSFESSSQDIALDTLCTTKRDNSIMESNHLGDEKLVNSVLNCSRLLAEFLKNICVLWRNKPLLAFQFLVPILVQLIWQTSIGIAPDHIKLGIMNEELTASSEQCSSEINPTLCRDNNLLSCYYTHKLTPSFDLVPYGTIDSGIEDVINGRTTGLIHFSKNYTQGLMARVFDTRLNTSDELVKNSLITVWLDSSNYIIYTNNQNNLKKALADLLNELFSLCQWGKPNFLPFAYHDPIYGSWTVSHLETTTPSYLIMLIMYFASVYPTAVLIEEKAASILKRASVSGVTAYEIILASFFTNCLLSAVHIIENLLAIFVIFRIPYSGSIINIFVIVFCSSIFGNLYGILIACLTKSAAVGIVSSLSLASFVTILSGVIWPQEAHAPVLKFFKWLYPGSYPADSLRSAMIRGKPLSDFSVFSGVLYLVGYNAALCIIICLIVQRTKALNV